MTTFQYFKPSSCEGLLGLDTDQQDWGSTLDQAKKRAAACLMCNPNCAIHVIAQMQAHAEFTQAIQTGKIKPETPEREDN